MSTQQKLLAAAVAAVVGLATSTACVAAEKKHEKCYGIVKAGKNDCGTPEHACAGYAKENNMPEEWIFVPIGTCDKITGASLKPIKKDQAGS